MTEKDIKHRCCDAFEEAKQWATDNEGWAPLVYLGDDGMIRIGDDKLPPIKFCPWCAAPISQTKGDPP